MAVATSEDRLLERLAIEPLSVMGLPPVEFVTLIADLGLRRMALALSALPNPYGYPSFSLREDASLRRETVAALRDRGVSVSLGDGFVLRPGADARDFDKDVSIMAELGAERINAVAYEPDLDRATEQLGALAEMAAAHGMQTTLEFSPGLTIADLPTALKVIGSVARPDFRLNVDTMHLVRSGASPADLAAVAPELIGYVQLSDSPRVPALANYMEEACFERMVPGTGDTPLLEILTILPRDVVIGLEVPLRSQADAGVGPQERLRGCIEATTRLLLEAGGTQW